MKERFFSVITPSWNQGKFLRGCIESVRGQGASDFEHWIFDNCSEDGTAEVAAGFSDVHFVREPDRGQSHAVNKGLAAAGGEIICWLNSDDEYLPGTFEALREVFSDPAVHVVFGDVRQVSYDGRDPVRMEARFEDRLDLVRWWSSRAKLHQPAVFFRRSVVEQVGPLREDLHYAMDYEWWWRMSEKHRFQYLPRELAVQHRQPESKTVVAWPRVLEERERVFAPHYGLIDAGDRRGLMREKRRLLARQFLMQAWTSPDRGLARQSLIQAWKESPPTVIHPSTLGLLRRIL